MSNDYPHLLPKKSFWIDKRLLDLKHNEFAWRCDIPENKDEWREHRDFTRAQLALAAGLTKVCSDQCMNDGAYSKILISRPNSGSSDPGFGYLPGSLDEKIEGCYSGSISYRPYQCF